MGTANGQVIRNTGVISPMIVLRWYYDGRWEGTSHKDVCGLSDPEAGMAVAATAKRSPARRRGTPSTNGTPTRYARRKDSGKRPASMEFPDDLYDDLKDQSDYEERSMAAITRQAVREYLDQHPRPRRRRRR